MRYRLTALLLALGAGIGIAAIKVDTKSSSAATPRCVALKASPGVKKGQLIPCPVSKPQPAPAPSPTPVVMPAAARGPIGMNLVGLSFYSSENPFIDRMRNSQGWLVAIPGKGLKTVQEAGIKVDASGTPTALPAGLPYLATTIPFDDLGTGTTRRYVLLYDGDFVFGGGPGIKVVDRQPGKITFEQAEYGPQQMTFSERFNNVHNIHVVREDQLALFQAGQTFNPAFLDRVKRFSPIRFMDWQATNNSKVVHWADRQPIGNAVWANNGGTIGEAGAPVELMVQLANEAHVEPWLCIPAHADDDYIRQFATYVRDHLAADLKPHFEYSNEVWNGSFEQAHYAAAQGQALLGATDYANEVYYGYRAAQVANIVRSVIGDRARMVISVWTTWPASTPYVFQGIAKVGDARKLFNEYAVTTYWGGAFAGRNKHDIDLIVGWAKSGQGGVDAAFDAIVNGGVFEENEDSLAAAAKYYVPHAALAQQYGLDLVAYEGGFGTDAYFGFGNDTNRVADFIRRMKASPRMGVSIKRMIDDFRAAGGKSLAYYDDVGDITWGATSTIYGASPTLDALAGVNAAPGR